MRKASCQGMVVSLLFFFAGLLLLAGCARTAPVSYYQLSALEAVATPAPSATGAGGLVIGIGPLRLPEYLDRAQRVTRLSANRLHLAEGHRWAEPLGENIPRVLGENLSALLGTDRILLHPWPSARTADYQLLAQVLHFENESDGVARLVVRWSVKGREGGMALPERRSSYRVPAAGQEQEKQVAALNEALALWCLEVARGVLALTP